MIDAVLLVLVSLLVAERSLYYLFTLSDKQWKEIWYYIRFWKPIRRSIRLYFIKNYPDISVDLYDSWNGKAFYTVHDSEEKIRFHRAASQIFWRLEESWTEQDKKDMQEYERLHLLWKKEKFKMKLQWLKSNHPKYYWLHKLHLI